MYLFIWNRAKQPKGLEVRGVEKVNRMDMLCYEVYL